MSADATELLLGGIGLFLLGMVLTVLLQADPATGPFAPAGDGLRDR